jgi:hypothetical protein
MLGYGYGVGAGLLLVLAVVMTNMILLLLHLLSHEENVRGETNRWDHGGAIANGRGVREPICFDLGTACNVNADGKLQTINCQTIERSIL